MPIENNFFNQSEHTMSENDEIQPSWNILKLENSIFSSTMVNTLCQKKVKRFSHSGAFQKLKMENFLQPWCMHYARYVIKFGHVGAF
jgi:hypothetical protein